MDDYKDDKRNNDQDLTRISKNNKSFLETKGKTPQEMVEFLKQGAIFRSFSYLISELYEGEDAAARLRKGFCEITGEKDEKIRKNVQNWMNGKSVPQKRETLFQICFLLGLDEEKSSRLLGSFSENRIHYRNPLELAYAFALRTGKSYREAVHLKEETLRIYQEEMDLHREEIREIERIRQENAERREEKSGTAEEKRQRREKLEREAVFYTERNWELFENVLTEEDYYHFIRQNSIYLGMQHETAYAEFMKLLNLLQEPGEERYFMKQEEEDGFAFDHAAARTPEAFLKKQEKKRCLPDERKYSMEQVVEDYFRMHVPQTTRVGKMTALQKVIKKCWPSETTLSRMKNREMDVNRKTLILLYMLTEYFDVEVRDEEELYYCDEEYTEEELFETRYDQMNMFLKKYGMCTLDYGNPFDLIICYAMYPSASAEEEDFVAERIEEVLEILYQGLPGDDDEGKS